MMENLMTKLISDKGKHLSRYILAASILLLSAFLLYPSVTFADGVKDRPYLALGADLKAKEKKTVLSLLGIDEDDLSDYKVVEITNKDEHKALDNYLASSVIGSRALSSVLIEKKKKGYGIEVTTRNISYCTEGMYQNALVTAGISDAEMTVAGPFEITGTAALVGAMNAYEDMTGEDISRESKDAATNELVVTSALADEIDDSEKAEEFLAMVKEEVLSADLKDTEDIMDVIDRCAEELDVDLSDEQRQEIADLMEKINKLDLNVDELKKQAGEIYEKISGLDLNQLEESGFFEKVRTALSAILESIQSLF